MVGLDSDVNYTNGLYKTLLGIISVIGAIAVVFNAIIAFLIARKIMHPIITLASHTEVVAQGDLSQEISVNRKDEIGRLAKGFEDMQSQLKSTITYV